MFKGNFFISKCFCTKIKNVKDFRQEFDKVINNLSNLILKDNKSKILFN